MGGPPRSRTGPPRRCDLSEGLELSRVRLRDDLDAGVDHLGDGLAGRGLYPLLDSDLAELARELGDVAVDHSLADERRALGQRVEAHEEQVLGLLSRLLDRLQTTQERV